MLHKRQERVDQSNSENWDLLRGDLKIKATGKTLGLRQWGGGGGFFRGQSASIVGRGFARHAQSPEFCPLHLTDGTHP